MEKDFIHCMFFMTFVIIVIFTIIKSFIGNKNLPFYTPRRLGAQIDGEIKILDNVTFNNIPAVIYQNYHDSSYITCKTIKNINHNIVNNPEFDFYLFTDNDARYYIEINYDNDLLNVYDKLKPHKRNELWKYCLLYKNGGAYIDINLKINSTLLNIITSEISDDADTVIFTKNKNLISTKLLIVPPGLPIFKELINSYLINENKSLSDLIVKYNYMNNIKFYIDGNKIRNVLTDIENFE